jgi:hypothetical protein
VLALESTITEFQRRRKATWYAIRWWLFVSCLTVVALLILPFTRLSSQVDLHLRIGVFLIFVFLVCVVVIRLQVRRLYRCPQCGKVPIRTYFGWRNEFGDEARDIQWNPADCPNCRTALR